MGRAKPRGQLKIIEEILTVALEGASKTQLVYRTNLNFKSIRRYLPILLERGLIVLKESPITTYVTTDKGKDFLSHYRKVRKLL